MCSFDHEIDQGSGYGLTYFEHACKHLNLSVLSKNYHCIGSSKLDFFETYLLNANYKNQTLPFFEGLRGYCLFKDEEAALWGYVEGLEA